MCADDPHDKTADAKYDLHIYQRVHQGRLSRIEDDHRDGVYSADTSVISAMLTVMDDETIAAFMLIKRASHADMKDQFVRIKAIRDLLNNLHFPVPDMREGQGRALELIDNITDELEEMIAATQAGIIPPPLLKSRAKKKHGGSPIDFLDAAMDRLAELGEHVAIDRIRTALCTMHRDFAAVDMTDAEMKGATIVLNWLTSALEPDSKKAKAPAARHGSQAIDLAEDDEED